MSGGDLLTLDQAKLADLLAIPGYVTPRPWCQPNTYWARSDDSLLYVGACTDLRVRLRNHRWNAVTWWPLVTRVDVQIQPSKHEALRVERRSIRADAPIYNVHKPSKKRRPPQTALRAAITAELGEDPVSFSLRYRAVGHSWHSTVAYLERELPSHLHRLSMWQILSNWVYAEEDQ